jgi:endonuclease/exonuclease/phosphatase family metal-dependent hydrolase
VIESTSKVWRLTGTYGEPRWEDKYKTWDKLRELNQNNNLPWLIVGDFNEILFSTEKEGGNPRPQGCMDAFRDALMDCGLEDLGFSGDAFTWKRGRIRERLDRGVANGAWSVMHPAASVQHLDYIRSDHRPILVDTEAPMQHSSAKQKRFEAKWLQEKGFQEKVQQT